MAELTENKANVVNPHKPIKVLLKTVSQQITCFLCKGYLIDATTIVECLHSCKLLFVIDYSHQSITFVILSGSNPIHFTTCTYLRYMRYKFYIELIVGEGLMDEFGLKSDKMMEVILWSLYYLHVFSKQISNCKILDLRWRVRQQNTNFVIPTSLGLVWTINIISSILKWLRIFPTNSKRTDM